MNNLYTNLSEVRQEEQLDVLLKRGKCRIERIVSSGHCSPAVFWYNQDEGEWIVLIQGEAVLNVEGKLISLKTGDHLFLPKHTKHRVEKTSVVPVCIWLCVFMED